tara:strand:- start:122 stop:922 length:801 start_codon:yes stop_codon:yes gene_type:complete
MKIYDCITYFDEDVILKIRLNVLYKVVDKFIITEGAFNHRGIRRKLNFNIENYQEFSEKIIYLPVDDFPNLNDPWSMLKHQRNFANKYLKELDKNDYVIISDVDEIPSPSKILEFVKKNYDIGVFEQLMFYYKLNILNETSPYWHGSKICKFKYFKNPEWLRAYKHKQYGWWRIDKPKNLKIIKDGGWHYSFLYNIEGIVKKISSYQHLEYDNDSIKNKQDLDYKIKNKLDLFDRNYKYKRVAIDYKTSPNYIIKNQHHLIEWIDK